MTTQVQRVLDALGKNPTLFFEVLQKGRKQRLAGPWTDEKGNPAKDPGWPAPEVVNYYRKDARGDVVVRLERRCLNDVTLRWSYELVGCGRVEGLTATTSLRNAMDAVDNILSQEHGYLLV